MYFYQKDLPSFKRKIEVNLDITACDVTHIFFKNLFLPFTQIYISHFRPLRRDLKRMCQFDHH